jgi:hypothetical protein
MYHGSFSDQSDVHVALSPHSLSLGSCFLNEVCVFVLDPECW